MSNKAETKKLKRKKKEKALRVWREHPFNVKMKLENNKRNFSGENANFLARKKKKKYHRV